MASLQACGAVVLAGVMAGACGGSSGGLVGNDAGQDAPTSAQDAASGEGGPSIPDGGDGGALQDGGVGIDGSANADASDASDATPAPCPDVHGAYAITPVEGQGCGTSFSAIAPQCIRQGLSSGCGITFQSAVSGGGNVAINGDAALQGDGTFSGAALTEGTLSRTGCTGTWSTATSTMTVDCGGTGSSQACVLSLVRTATACP